MTHFPESDAYQDYLRQCGCSNPIVAPLTFNSGMTEGKSHQIGLRILYGAARAMSDNNAAAKSWSEFLALFPKGTFSKALTATDAVKILQSVYCRMKSLVLVDELSKAVPKKPEMKNGEPDPTGGDALAMTQIGALLENIHAVDVIVSALSPGYISALLSRSQRPIYYVFLGSLVDTDLGKEQTS